MRTTGRICLCAAATIVVMSWALHSSPQAQTSGWTPPKTPWGHPDLQGVYTNKDETNTPLERPAEFSGRSAKDFTAADLAALEPQLPTLLTPGAAEALVVKAYRHARTKQVAPAAALAACLEGYQNPVPADVLELQMRLAVREATDLAFVPPAFRGLAAPPRTA